VNRASASLGRRLALSIVLAWTAGCADDTAVFLDDRHRIDFYSRLGDFLVRHLLDGDVANREDPSNRTAPRRLP
jgi:hypothetical protein